MCVDLYHGSTTRHSPTHRQDADVIPNDGDGDGDGMSQVSASAMAAGHGYSDRGILQSSIPERGGAATAGD